MSHDNLYGSEVDDESGLLSFGDFDLLHSEIVDEGEPDDSDGLPESGPAEGARVLPPLNPPREINRRKVPLPPHAP